MEAKDVIIEEVSELELYINLLQRDKKKVYNNYDELIKDLKYEFNITTTKEQLDRVYSPTAEEAEEDVRMIYKTCVD